MFKSLFKIVFRKLWKYRTYTLINVMGLGIAIGAIVWGYQTYRFAFSYDSQHKETDKIYRVLTFKKDADGVRGLVPMPLVAGAVNDFSGIKNAARWDSRGASVRFEDKEVFAEQVHFTDPSFFSLFNFPLKAGSYGINDINAVLITEATAKKYFGNENPLGKTLTFYADAEYAKPLTITGILKNPPSNSTFQFSFITNFENCLNVDGARLAPDNWSWFLDAAFLQIPNPADARRIETELNRYVAVQNKARQDWKVTSFKLITVKENASLSTIIQNNGLYERPSDAAAYGALVLALLIFISACLNFSNTTVAQANRRLKEIGIRKVLGSSHRQLIRQLMLESAVVVVVAMLLSMAFNSWWLPTFSAMFGNLWVEANYLKDTTLQIFMLLLFVITTLMAGMYPAFYVSRFNATSIFRGNVKFGDSSLFSRIMLGLQLSIAIITVIAGVAFARNSEYQRNFDYGYNLESSMGVVFNDSSSYLPLKNDLAKIPEVTSLTGTRNHIAFGFRTPVMEADGLKKEACYMEVGSEYVKTMQLKLLQGRDFDPGSEADYNHALLITQKMAAEFGWSEQEALGKRVRMDSIDFSVVGIVKDFQMESLYNPLAPVAMSLGKESRYQYLIVQAKPENLKKVYAKVNDAWKRLFPTKPFNAFYQNQVKADAYATTEAIATIFKWFALVSILLTATGLFALVSLTALKKMKEIALRKVVGAKPGHIMVLLNKNYFWIFGISAILGCAGGWALTKLLLDLIFIYNSGVSPGTLLISVLALFAITAVITGIKVWEAIRTNPVKLLRTD
jgi:ABC-type antimicrobial peptide transport system permease subunit